MRKPVIEVIPETMGDYEYQAQRCIGNTPEFLASDSLNNLKKEIRDRGWQEAWLTMTKGAFSYGQNVVSNYPYRPKYACPSLFKKRGKNDSI